MLIKHTVTVTLIFFEFEVILTSSLGIFSLAGKIERVVLKTKHSLNKECLNESII
jgi:hypothetical protein